MSARKCGFIVALGILAIQGLPPVYAADPDILVAESRQISRITPSGDVVPFLKSPGPVRVCDGEVLVVGREIITAYDAQGKELRRIPIPSEVKSYRRFAALPDGRFAFMDNKNDAIYFIGPKGEHLKTVSFNKEPDRHLQNMDGIVVGDQLVVSENGHRQLISIHLSSYKVSIFRDLRQLLGWLGAITFGDGTIYLCQSRRVYAISSDSDQIRRVATTPEANITGITFVKGHLFAVVNGMSKIKERSLAAKRRTNHGVLYKIDPNSGEVKVVKDGLNFPEGVFSLVQSSKSNQRTNGTGQ